MRIHQHTAHSPSHAALLCSGGQGRQIIRLRKTDWQGFRSGCRVLFQGRKHFIARKMNVDRFLRIGSVNNAVHQIQGWGAGDASTNVLFENFVINRGEISINVTANHITKSISKLLRSHYRAVLALLIGIGIKYESALKNFTQNGMQCIVNDPVSKRRRGNDSMLGVKYFYLPVASKFPSC